MATPYSTFENFKIFTPLRLLKEIAIKRAFSEVITLEFNDFHLCLSRFSDERPLKYYNKALISKLYGFLKQDSKFFLDSILESEDILNDAVFRLLRRGSSWGLEKNIDISTPKNIEEFETIWHPEYLRYFESIYKKLLEPILLTIDQKKGTNLIKTNPINQATKLEELGLKELLVGNNSTIRNSISHGKVGYDFSQIIYKDFKKSETLFPADLLRLFDGIVETCNSIAITFILLLAEYYAKNKLLLKNLPLCFSYLMFDGLFSSDGFKILSFHESLVNNKPQLNIICQLYSANRITQAFYSMNLCYNIIRYRDIGYGRFAISIECGKPLAASIFIDGIKLKNAIKRNLTIEESKDVIESNLLWYTTSNIKRKIDNYIQIGKVQYKIYKIERRKELSDIGFKLFKNRYEVKDIENRSTNNIARIYAYVWIKEIEGLDMVDFHKLVKYITKRLRQKRYHCTTFKGKSFFKKRPSYIWIDFFSADRSVRYYKRHMNESYYILQAEWISRSEKNNAILLKNPDEVINKIRYRYNPNSEILTISRNE